MIVTREYRKENYLTFKKREIAKWKRFSMFVKNIIFMINISLMIIVIP